MILGDISGDYGEPHDLPRLVMGGQGELQLDGERCQQAQPCTLRLILTVPSFLGVDSYLCMYILGTRERVLVSFLSRVSCGFKAVDLYLSPPPIWWFTPILATIQEGQEHSSWALIFRQLTLPSVPKSIPPARSFNHTLGSGGDGPLPVSRCRPQPTQARRFP